MHAQVSVHFAGNGTYRVLLFSAIYPCASQVHGNAMLLLLDLLGLRKLPNANHCGLRPPSRESACLLDYDYWTPDCQIGKFSMSIAIRK